MSRVRTAITVAAVLAFALLGGPLARASADPPDPKPALELHLDTVAGDGTTPDSSANGLTAQVTGSLGAGRWDQALAPASDGDGDGVNDNAALKPDTLTLVAWVKRSGMPGANRIIVGKQGLIAQAGEVPCAGYSYALITGPSGGLRFTLETDQGTAVESETPELSPTTGWDGNWHMIAGTWDGSSMQLWVDGQPQGSPTSVGSLPILQGDCDTYPAGLFGGYVDHGAVTSCDASAAEYTGGLDELRLYPRALSGDELAYLARADLTSPPDLAKPQPWPPPHTHIALIPANPNAQGYYDTSIHRPRSQRERRGDDRAQPLPDRDRAGHDDPHRPVRQRVGDDVPVHVPGLGASPDVRVPDRRGAIRALHLPVHNAGAHRRDAHLQRPGDQPLRNYRPDSSKPNVQRQHPQGVLTDVHGEASLSGSGHRVRGTRPPTSTPARSARAAEFRVQLRRSVSIERSAARSEHSAR